MHASTYNQPDEESADIFYLLVTTARILKFEFEKQLAALNLPIPISGPRLRLMMEVWKAERIRMNELAAKLELKPRTITDFVNALERNGLIQRSIDPTDRRATILSLTDMAKPHIKTIRSVSAEIAEKLMEKLSAEQRGQLKDLLVTLV
ncbi:MarR family transcriptional regulator [Paenibacillus cellulosilyticus]|uniref:MarR family transcriptional regulator n=1 Tax=Paenibacillus cellulosilyticus TaxID=375489 RepID=A0A2V2Z4G9_9BACL|nr:MarR family transcriptional regulator [Paenibacillus cellulosilyticus]PWW08700.1 MarR family transcriptional regulator [Paenibacillus cellulosilyticus]QKS48266.1 MarR family transcriptional regulator [Paenibacillus cellulosilyticus]